MGSLTSTLVVSLKDDVSGPARKVGAALKEAGKQVQAISKAGFSDRLSGQLAQLGLRAKDIDKVSASWKQYASAQGLAGKSSDWTKSQTSQVRAWETATVASLRNVSRARRQFAVQQERAAAVAAKPEKSSGGLLAAGAGALTGYKAKEFVKKAIVSMADFDIGTRKQRAFTGVSSDVQDRILIPQAKRIGQDTQFSNLDVVKAQTKAMQGLPGFNSDLRAEVGAAIVDSVKNYALTMDADLEGSSEAIRTFLQATQKDISTKEKAVAEATRATNLMVKMAKLGGMNDEDVQQFMKFGAGTSTAAGLSDTTLAALGATGRRGGLRGDELGVFVRAMSSRLVAPTSKGLDALTAAGIDYNQFTKMPGGLSVNNLNDFSKRRFGKGFNSNQTDRLDDILDNPEIVSNREEFTKQVSDIVAESFDKKKNGKTKAQDAQKISKMVGDFYKLSTESVDAEGLLNAIMTNPKMGIALLNAFLSEKHGGKGKILGSKWDDFGSSKGELEGVTNDPGFAKRLADEIMGGIGGAFERAKGSVENFQLAVGQANETLAKFSLNKFGDALDAISNLPDPVRRFASELGIATAAVVGLKGLEGLTNGFGLKGSALALEGSATALTAAAQRLGGGVPGPGAPGAPGAPAGAKPSAFSLLVPWAVYLTGREAMDGLFGALPKPNYPAGYDPKAELDKSTFQRISDLLRPGLSTPGGQTNFAPWVANSAGSVWSKGADPIEGLQLADQTGALGSKNAASYAAGFSAGLQAVDSAIDAAMLRWSAKLGSFSASPSITPKFAPAPSVGKGASLGAGKQAAHADYGFSAIG